MAMFAIPNERMEGSVGVSEVHTLTVGTSNPFSIDAFEGSPPTFHLAPGVQDQEQALHPRREWWRDDRQGNRLECVA